MAEPGSGPTSVLPKLASSSRKARSSFLTPCLAPQPHPSYKWEFPAPPQSSHLAGSNSLICLLLSTPHKSRPHHLWSRLLRQPPAWPCLPSPEPKGLILNPSLYLPLNYLRMKISFPHLVSKVINIPIFLASHYTP